MHTCLKRLLPILLLLFPVAAYAQNQAAPVDQANSTLSYTGRHPLHSWTGVSQSVQGTLMINQDDPSQSSVEIVIPVESFDSGNGNRDSNMLETVEASSYPDVRFTSESVTVERWDKTTEGYTGRWIVRGPLTFHGKTHTVEIPADVKIDESSFEAVVSFEVSLGQHDVKRPKLMLMAISDTISLEGVIHATLSEANASF